MVSDFSCCSPATSAVFALPELLQQAPRELVGLPPRFMEG